MDEFDGPRNQTIPPELDELEDDLPEYQLHDASRRMLSGTADATDDGRIQLNLDSKIAHVFARLIQIPDEDEEEVSELPPEYSGGQVGWNIPMNIVLQVVGSRGDVQPFVALGNELQTYGHRVRLATHPIFKTFVTNAGLEFYPIGGDPAELMAYMVKNPGLIPNMQTLREHEISKKRTMIATMLIGCWKSCVEPDPDSGVPFLANAIIANPPSFAHVHCAQALSIPVHLVFTMPWTATRSFSHPLANMHNSSTDLKLANYLSFGLVQVLTWQGLGDIINDWRRSLGLEAVPLTEGPFIVETLKIPYTYCWSPALVPKPTDWASHIDVCGFMFQTPKPYTPNEELDEFLKAGPPPVYIGFGSIVVDDPDALLAIVLSAVEESGVRAIISKGWSNLDIAEKPDTVLFLGDCPHDWLFQHVSAVVHHGGAGTTAAGLRFGKPTAIVPFFGDQPFWGDMVASSGAGPPPIPHKRLTASKLADAIKFCLSAGASSAAQAVATRMQSENGVTAAVASFHRHLPSDKLRCDLVPTLPAVYEYSRNITDLVRTVSINDFVRTRTLKLSGSAADTLVKYGKIKPSDLTLYESNQIHIVNHRWDVMTGSTQTGLAMSFDLLRVTNDLWYAPHKLRKGKAATNDDSGEGPSTINKHMSNAKQAAKLVGASAMTIPKIYGVLLKGFAVDAPLAIAEGLRATPRLMGEEVKDHEPITGFGSGMKVAGKDMVTQFGYGLADLVVQPYKGAKEDGALGALKGFGRGSLGMFFKPFAGMAGLVAYPAQGVYKSLRAAAYTKTKKQILSARRVHDIYFVRTEGGKVDEQQVLDAFDAFRTQSRTLSRIPSRISMGSGADTPPPNT